MADPVNFTRPAAERISRVVRAVEFGSRDSTGPSLDRPWYEESPFKLQLGTFTGNWQTAQFTTVTLHGTTNTLSVYNWTAPAAGLATSDTSCARYVIFGKVRGTHTAVEIQLRATCQTCVQTLGSIDVASLPGYSANEIQLLGHNNSACLQWYSITTCATATA